MVWLIPFYKCARTRDGQRQKRTCFRWALLCIGLVLASPNLTFADETRPNAPDLTFDPDARPFTSAQLRMLRHLIDQAKQRITPEYYLSEEYLNETPVNSQLARRVSTQQAKWKKAALERKKIRTAQRAEQEANRARLRKLRDQERNVRRLQREAQIARHRQEFCTRFQRRARHQQRSRFTAHTTYRIHPICL